MMKQEARIRWWADDCIRNIVLVLLSALGIASCSGGGETGTGMTDQGTTKQQVVIGEITGFGSVFVNGIEFDIGKSSVQIGDNQGSESDLAVGMVVAVVGDVGDKRHTGRASIVAFDNEVEGEVLANDYPTSLNVMGQTVIFDNDTVFESDVPGVVAVKDIRKKDRVEVSGFTTNDGTIYATRIRLTTEPGKEGNAMVKGRIASLSLDKQQFFIGGLPVSFDTATAIQSNSTLEDGLLVKVLSNQPVNGNQSLYAERIMALDARGYDKPGAAMEMEGAVTGSLTGNQFQLNGVAVQLADNTQINGGQRTAIVVGQKLRVRGGIASDNLAADNILHAEHVAFVNTSKLELIATIESLDYMANTVTVLGQAFHVNSMTIMRHDRQNPSEAIFNLAHLSPGDDVEIKGYPMSDGSGYTATSLERSTEPSVSVEGVIDALEGSLLHIGPFAIDVAQLPPGQFKSGDVGRKVQLSVDYNANAGTMVATAFEYED